MSIKNTTNAKNSVQTLRNTFCPFQEQDMEIACEIGDKVWLDEQDIFEIICLNAENVAFEEMNLVSAILYEIIEQANRHIHRILGYNMLDCNNWVLKSWDDIHQYIRSKYDGCSYEYDQEAIDHFKQSIQPHILQLREDRECEFILKELELV